MIDQHSAVDYERCGKEQHKGAMAMVTNNSAKEEGIRTSDSKLQVFAAGTPDLESGAKTAARYSKNGEAANTARDLVPAISAPPEVRIENYDAAETKACIYHSPDCVYLADPQGSSMEPGYFGYKPELKEGDIQANLTSDIDPAFNYDKAAAAAAGKEGVDKTTPAPVDDDNDERAATVMADGQANAVKERAIAYNKLAATAFKRIADATADGMVETMCNHEAGALPKKGTSMQQVLPPRRGSTRCFATRTSLKPWLLA